MTLYYRICFLVGFLVGIVLTCLWWFGYLPGSSPTAIDGAKGAGMLFLILAFPLGWIPMIFADTLDGVLPAPFDWIIGVLFLISVPFQWGFYGLLFVWILSKAGLRVD